MCTEMAKKEKKPATDSEPLKLFYILQPGTVGQLVKDPQGSKF
jgi:hypothetical protein